MVVLPDALFAWLAKLENGEKQDKGIINSWVDPHQLKKINGVWQKDGVAVISLHYN